MQLYTQGCEGPKELPSLRARHFFFIAGIWRDNDQIRLIESWPHGSAESAVSIVREWIARSDLRTRLL